MPILHVGLSGPTGNAGIGRSGQARLARHQRRAPGRCRRLPGVPVHAVDGPLLG
jgi:hypothetical protein